MNFLDKGQCVKGYVVESIISSNGFYEAYKVIDENNTTYLIPQKSYCMIIKPFWSFSIVWTFHIGIS